MFLTTRPELQAGIVIVYVLRADQLPVHPEKEWRGKIKKVYSSIDAVEVEVLNEGYKGYEERVYFEQIIRIASEDQ